MVFDASLNATEPFLNDCLYSCSSLHESLFVMLLRFCFNNIAFFLVQETFLSNFTSQQWQDFVGFLWFEDVKNLNVTTNKDSCCIYIKIHCHNNSFVTSLVTFKSKVSTIKLLSIPELEFRFGFYFTGSYRVFVIHWDVINLFLVRFCSRVTLCPWDFISQVLMEFLPFIEMPSIYYWSDSVVELPCVHGNGKPSDIHVRRRLDEVQKLVNVTWWYYVESMEIWLIQQTLFLGAPLFLKIIAERLMVSRTTSLLLDDTA